MAVDRTGQAAAVARLAQLRREGALTAQELVIALHAVLSAPPPPPAPPPAPAPALRGSPLYCGVRVQAERDALERTVLSACGHTWSSLAAAGLEVPPQLHVTTYFKTEADERLWLEAARLEGTAMPIRVLGLAEVDGSLLCAACEFGRPAPPFPEGKRLHITLATKAPWVRKDSNAVLRALDLPYRPGAHAVEVQQGYKGRTVVTTVRYHPLPAPVVIPGVFFIEYAGPAPAPSREGPPLDKGLAVFLCGIPGCGKDFIGRQVKEVCGPGAAAFSQDEHGKKARGHFEELMTEGRDPIFVLRNNFAPQDRKNYAELARKHRYSMCAIYPQELSEGDLGLARLLTVSVASCYLRLTDDAQGHETLTVVDQKTREVDMTLPMRIALSFALRFRPPSASEGFLACLAVPFLHADCALGLDAARVAAELAPLRQQRPGEFGKDPVPGPLAELVCDTLPEMQSRLRALPIMRARREPAELVDRMHRFVGECRAKVPAPGASPAAERARPTSPPREERPRRAAPPASAPHKKKGEKHKKKGKL
eukprot:TRINITY_DN25856_c1_g1_i1.p1 TRINITY_DN25856_c1_g1~~TRINITY_DN25856_c1_g1_i1.p1  ORF type:complete len:537 (+),score=173.62 TRINITY_DN25856_c1_g1_i1:97-1707(+)